MIEPASAYVGRFAPSPTGPLHAGSLVAALASYLDARHHGGVWLLRIDDIDPPRAVAGATDWIVNSLLQHGMSPDRAATFQSTHSERYDQALQQLDSLGLLFRCRCSRSDLGPGGACMRHCGQREYGPEVPTSVRIHVPHDTQIEFEDLILGSKSQALGSDVPNFVLLRKDGLYAYQLAAAVDDTEGISHVVRGQDLLPSTFRQLFIQHCLGLPSPRYGHLPLVFDPEGNKLSKQTGAPALDDACPSANLRAALNRLGQEPPPEDLSDPESLLDWSVQHWQRERIPK